MAGRQYPAPGRAWFNDWAGVRSYRVTVLRETPKRYFIRWEESCRKGKAGTTCYAPKRAITFDEKES